MTFPDGAWQGLSRPQHWGLWLAGGFDDGTLLTPHSTKDWRAWLLNQLFPDHVYVLHVLFPALPSLVVRIGRCWCKWARLPSALLAVGSGSSSGQRAGPCQCHHCDLGSSFFPPHLGGWVELYE